jgi:hypothetical protein
MGRLGDGWIGPEGAPRDVLALRDSEKKWSDERSCCGLIFCIFDVVILVYLRICAQHGNRPTNQFSMRYLCGSFVTSLATVSNIPLQAAMQEDHLYLKAHVQEWVTISWYAALESHSNLLEDGPETCDPGQPEEDHGEVLTGMYGPGCSEGHAQFGGLETISLRNVNLPALGRTVTMLAPVRRRLAKNLGLLAGKTLSGERLHGAKGSQGGAPATGPLTGYSDRIDGLHSVGWWSSVRMDTRTPPPEGECRGKQNPHNGNLGEEGSQGTRRVRLSDHARTVIHQPLKSYR